MAGFRLIVVEDDPGLRSVLARGLIEEGFAVDAVGDGSGALAAARERVDALVIDIGLPDADGRDVCQALRAQGCDAPVLFLTARDAVTDRLAGFGAGGDDYVTKPFHFAELVAPVLDNARRFARHAVRVTLRRGPATVRLEITDDGPGIPADALERVFEPGTRLEADGDGHRGSGLGLALARRPARAAHADVSAETATAGARFVVLLPR